MQLCTHRNCRFASPRPQYLAPRRMQSFVNATQQLPWSRAAPEHHRRLLCDRAARAPHRVGGNPQYHQNKVRSISTNLGNVAKMVPNSVKVVPNSKLFVSEPPPSWFGNPENPGEPPPGWTNGNWLKSRFHFSFAEYSSGKNESFGCIRVMNDDLVQPARGFGTHGGAVQVDPGFPQLTPPRLVSTLES